MKNLSCFKEFAKYSSLNVLGMLGLSCYILADTFFISKGTGADGLTALNLAIPIYSFIHGSGLMLGMGGGTKYSIRKSQGKHNEADRIFTNSVFLAVIFAAVFMLAGIFMSAKIVTLLGADKNVYQMTKIYLQVILLFSPFFLINNITLCFVRNDGAPQLSMAAMACGSFANIILDYVFIFPCRMGIFGAVLATGIAPVISLAILSPHFLKKKNQFHFVKCRPGIKRTAEIFSSGIPSLVTEVSSGIVIIVFNFVILNIKGNTGVAAYGIVANISLVIMSIYTGIAQGMQPVASRNHGAGNKENTMAVLGYALVAMLFFSVAVYTGIFFLAEEITMVFNSGGNQMLQEIAVKGLKLYFTSCPFTGFNIIMSMYFTSAERVVPAQVISLLRGIIIIIPVALVFPVLAGMEGVWCAMPFTEMAVAVISGTCYLYTARS